VDLKWGSANPLAEERKCSYVWANSKLGSNSHTRRRKRRRSAPGRELEIVSDFLNFTRIEYKGDNLHL